MLITDDSNGTSDGKEKDQLQAITAVGSEFITYRDDQSTVQKSGEFARFEKQTGESQPRFVLLHETAQAYAEPEPGKLSDLIGNELLSLPPNTKLRKRSRLYVSELDSENGDLPFREIGKFKATTRIPRYRGFTRSSAPRSLEAMHETNYTANAGKRRLFSKGDGKLLMVREVAVPGDARYFNDSLREQLNDPQPYTKKRGLRAARVEVVEVDPIAGNVGDAVFSFDIHSGLSFDPTPRSFSSGVRSTADMYSSTQVFAAFSGVMFGSSLDTPNVSAVPVGGDASDTYAVAEPALAKASDGREYLSVIAVYPASDDVYDSRSAGPYRLTCKRTTAGGGVELSKINFPALPSLPLHYLAARGMSLHRLSPTTVALRVNVHVMQYGAGGSIQAVNSDAFFMWTQNNGGSWTYAPVTAGFPGVFPYGGMLVKDKGTLLAFSWFRTGSSPQMEVHSITSTGTAQVSSINGSTFSTGLMTPGVGQLFVPYLPIGFGGSVYRIDPQDRTKKKKRLWMQFDPYWIYEKELPQVLEYPGSRPMLLVSDDGGTTWVRKFLPSVWSFRVGFVTAVDERTLAVPVYSARKEPGATIRATIHLSRDGGDTWKATGAGVTLPGETYVDGQTVIGAEYSRPSPPKTFQDQDVVDTALRYCRGELLPIIALRGADGKLLPANPARPWMNNHNIKEPDYA